MQIRIETDIPRQALKAFLDKRKLYLPVFFDNREHLVININPRNRADVITLIDWLMTQP